MLTYRNSVINYYRFGKGTKLIICFHGYGENATSFSFLEKYSDQFSFIAIDLPFHGKTEWNEGLNFTPDNLAAIINRIIHETSNKPQPINEKLTLLGFSLGGRAALSLYQFQPGSINSLVLLAPDGLKMNFWYWLSTQTWAGRKTFYFTMKHPEWFFILLKALNKLKLVNASIFKFVNSYIADKQIRILLYQRWVTLRKLKPRISLIKPHILNYKTIINLIYGKHDRIILSTRGEKFRDGIEAYCSLKIMESGHQVLQEKYAGEIVNALGLAFL